MVFRCDGGPGIGLGHVTRCSALASAFRALGWRCRFAASRQTRHYLGGETVFTVRPGLAGAKAVARAKADVLVVDHYGLGAGYEAAARGSAALVAVIDDLANRAHRCDVLLDSNPGRTARDYRGRVGPGKRLLLGLDYALLRPTFARRGRASRRKPPGRAKRLLVLLGAADPARASERVLAALARVPVPVRATLVIGPANPRRGALERAARAIGVAAVTNPADLRGLMRRSDLALAAASTGSLELACLGVPALLVATAANQQSLARALSRAGAATLLGESRRLGPGRIAEAIAALAGDPRRRARMAAAGRKLIDGRGAPRAAATIAGMLAAKQRGMRS